MATKNGESKRYVLSDKLVTDEIGKKLFEDLEAKFKGMGESVEVKRERLLSVNKVLAYLKEDGRLWHHDGTAIT